MSYDINFWKLAKATKKKPAAIYKALCADNLPKELAPLPIDQILAALQRKFKDFNPGHPLPLVRTPGGSVEFSWSDVHFRFDVRGDLEPAYTRLVKLMAKFDCPLYDPQEDVRYDAADGMRVRMPKLDTAAGAKPELAAYRKRHAHAISAQRVARQLTRKFGIKFKL